MEERGLRGMAETGDAKAAPVSVRVSLLKGE
jgi:hypothetical protein